MKDVMNCSNCTWKLITINHTDGTPPVKGNITACSFCGQPYHHDGTSWIPFTKQEYQNAPSSVRDQIDVVWTAIEKFKQGMRDKGLIG